MEVNYRILVNSKTSQQIKGSSRKLQRCDLEGICSKEWGVCVSMQRNDVYAQKNGVCVCMCACACVRAKEWGVCAKEWGVSAKEWGVSAKEWGVCVFVRVHAKEGVCVQKNGVCVYVCVCMCVQKNGV